MRHDPDVSRLGTFPLLKPYKRVDSRSCPKCGAVAGRCEHMAADDDIIWLTHSHEWDESRHRWKADEIERLRKLRALGNTRREIADILNTTENAVAYAVKTFLRNGEEG